MQENDVNGSVTFTIKCSVNNGIDLGQPVRRIRTV